MGDFTPTTRPLYELDQRILYPITQRNSDRALELFSTNPEEERRRYVFRMADAKSIILKLSPVIISKKTSQKMNLL